MLGTLTIALGGAWVLGRALGVRGDTQTLIGVGTAICGASAIAATTAVLKPKVSQVAYALGTIFTFNVIAVLTFPALGHLLGMSPPPSGCGRAPPSTTPPPWWLPRTPSTPQPAPTPSWSS